MWRRGHSGGLRLSADSDQCTRGCKGGRRGLLPSPGVEAQKRDDLIIDVGMHVGEDTAYYLAKGFDVVAVEANSALVEQVTAEFADEVARGRLRIFNVAIADRPGTQSFAISDEMPIWSSMSPDFIARNEATGTRYRYVDVPAVRFEDILREVGIPHYLKVDIEGLDMLCVRALEAFDDRPDFVSIESHVSIGASPFETVFDELARLWALDYRAFQY